MVCGGVEIYREQTRDDGRGNADQRGEKKKRRGETMKRNRDEQRRKQAR